MVARRPCPRDSGRLQMADARQEDTSCNIGMQGRRLPGCPPLVYSKLESDASTPSSGEVPARRPLRRALQVARRIILQSDPGIHLRFDRLARTRPRRLLSRNESASYRRLNKMTTGIPRVRCPGRRLWRQTARSQREKRPHAVAAGALRRRGASECRWEW